MGELMAGICGAGLPLLFFFGDSPPPTAKMPCSKAAEYHGWWFSWIGSEGSKEHGKGFGQRQD
jgi:hypothetical protein